MWATGLHILCKNGILVWRGHDGCFPFGTKTRSGQQNQECQNSGWLAYFMIHSEMEKSTIRVHLTEVPLQLGEMECRIGDSRFSAPGSCTILKIHMNKLTNGKIFHTSGIANPFLTSILDSIGYLHKMSALTMAPSM